jgi:small-conductance mechanosensitive channel
MMTASSELDTPDNKRIIIPNKSVWGGNIVNFTRHKSDGSTWNSA